MYVGIDRQDEMYCKYEINNQLKHFQIFETHNFSTDIYGIILILDLLYEVTENCKFFDLYF